MNFVENFSFLTAYAIITAMFQHKTLELPRNVQRERCSCSFQQ